MNNDQTLVRQEFALDRLHRHYKGIIEACERGEAVPAADRCTAMSEMPIIEKRLRNVQRKLYGWRAVEDIYGEKSLDEAERLKKEILDLEAQEVEYKGRIRNYPEASKMAQQKVDELKGHLGSRVGYNPKEGEFEKAHNELLRVDHEFAIAREDLPGVQRKLDELRNRLEKLNNANGATVKTNAEKTQYASPGEEVDQKAKKYAEAYKVSYSEAVTVVLDRDTDLARAYING